MIRPARVLLAAVASVLVVGVTAPASAAPTELEADDNVATAIAWSRLAFPDGGADTALLGRDDVFADSLASGGAQGRLGAPLLLTGSDDLDERTESELARLGVDRVVLLGGNGALAAGVEEALIEEGYLVERVQGGNRVATAVAIADRFFGASSAAILVRADGEGTAAFADSLAAGALAAAVDAPLLLTDTGQLAAETREYLLQGEISVMLVVGGPAAVSDAVLDELVQLGVTARRVAGTNRFGTAAAASTFTLGGGLSGITEDEPAGEPTESSVGQPGPQPTEPGSEQPPRLPSIVALVDGEDPDGWADGFAAAVLEAPVLLSGGDRLPAESVPLFIGIEDAGLTVVCGTTVAETPCERAGIAASAEALDITASRVAFMEPAQGSGTGLGALLPTDDAGSFCYQLFALGAAEPVTTAQIREGEDGPTVAELDTASAIPGAPAGFGVAVNCVFDEDPELVASLFDDPRDYTLELGTPSRSDALSGEFFPPDRALFAFLTGDQEVPVPGDPNGFGVSQVFTTDRPDELCVLSIVFLQPPATAAHIHEAPEGVPGPIVADLPTPSPDGFGPARCLDGVDPDLVTDLEDDPSGYYVNVHNEPYPEGAIRGQLFDAETFAGQMGSGSDGMFPGGGSFGRMLRLLEP